MLLALLLLIQEDPLARLTAEWEANANAPLLNRIAYVKEIAALKTPAAADYLIKRLRGSRSWEINTAIARELRANGTRNAFGALKEILDRSAEPVEVRRAALESAAAWADDDALEVVARWARMTHPSNDLRPDAVARLAAFPIAKTRKHWVKLLEESEEEVLVPALTAVAPLKDKECVVRAAEIYANARMSEAIRAAAVAPLRAMDDLANARVLLGGPIEPGGAVDRAAAAALGAATDPETIKLLQQIVALGEKPAMRELCVRALAAQRRPELLPTLVKALEDKQEWIRETAVAALAAQKAAEAWTALAEFARKGAARSHVTAIDALGGADEAGRPAAEAALGLLADSPHPDVRVAALLAIGRLAAPAHLDLLARRLDHAHWPTRSAAIEALRSYRTGRSVELLIERLGKEDGRLRWDIVLSLRALTGKSLGTTPDPWIAWWARARDGFTFADPQGHPDPAAVGATRAYYGVPLLSKRIVFCIDSSSSMRASVGLKSTPKLKAAKEQLEKTLEGLEPDVRFNLIFFADRAEVWKRELQPATRANVLSAIARANQEQPDGQTNIFDTLMAGLADAEADTIFLLSDGDPTMGRYTDRERILAEFGSINRTRRVNVHTISLGPSPFLKELAGRTGGQYVEK